MFFLNFTRINLKRLTKYIPSVIVSILFLLAVCSLLGITISKNMYKEKTNVAASVAFYLPKEDRTEVNELAISAISSNKSMKETIKLIEVDSKDEGFKLLNNGDVLYLIIMPDQFVDGLYDGTNTPLEIVLKDNFSVKSYITNEVFLSYATYLGIAQAAVYSALDNTRAAGYERDHVKRVQTSVNFNFIERSLNKAQYIEEISATSVGAYSLKAHYLASACMLSLFFTGFVLMPFMLGYKKGMLTLLENKHSSNLFVFTQNFICMLVCVFIAYIPCHIAINIFVQKFNTFGLYKLLPVALIIAFVLSLSSILCKNEFTANILLLVTALVIAYIGGGIVPTAMLPGILHKLSGVLPGRYMISLLSYCLFGGIYAL